MMMVVTFIPVTTVCRFDKNKREKQSNRIWSSLRCIGYEQSISMSICGFIRDDQFYQYQTQIDSHICFFHNFQTQKKKKKMSIPEIQN
jgi:hypothetical protein